MRFQFLSLIISSLFFVANASATVVLDQTNDFTSGVGSETADDRIGQTFTVGVGGLLDHIDLRITRVDLFGQPGPAILTVHTTAAGLPSSELGSVQVPALSIANVGQAFVTFDVSGLGIAVSPGQELAFDVRNDTGNGFYAVPRSEISNYGGGPAISKNLMNPWQTQVYDHSFKTFVAVPEPSPLLLIGFLFVPLLARKATVLRLWNAASNR